MREGEVQQEVLYGLGGRFGGDGDRLGETRENEDTAQGERKDFRLSGRHLPPITHHSITVFTACTVLYRHTDIQTHRHKNS